MKEKTISLPLVSISKFEKVDKQNSRFIFRGADVYSIDIFPKDFRPTIRVVLDPQNEKHPRDVICDYLRSNVFPTEITVSFAFISRRDKQFNFGRKPIYDPTCEFARMGVGITRSVSKDSPTSIHSEWILSNINQDYSLCPTYPPFIVVPTKATKEILESSANFRTKSRLPVLTWRNPSGACLLRCSQPRVGISINARSNGDEAMFAIVQQTNRVKQKLFIVDARPMKNALANMAVGGGYENLTNYSNCQLEFRGLPNIHVIRESAQKLKGISSQSILF